MNEQITITLPVEQINAIAQAMNYDQYLIGFSEQPAPENPMNKTEYIAFTALNYLKNRVNEYNRAIAIEQAQANIEEFDITPIIE